jgi:DNA processing protein|tara:strand:- start:661 stop:1827 length:1167 start_codon:yes stop_codon:yes gene_type:complete
MSADGYLAALAGLQLMNPNRLRHVLHDRTAVEAFDMATGVADPSPVLATIFRKNEGLAGLWRQQRADQPPEFWAASCVAADVQVVGESDPCYPAQLLGDPGAPAVLFVRGDLSVLDARRVGIIGTRNATQQGRATAARFGAELADAGVVIVSGLARGIDTAAHRGALHAPTGRPVGIVGNGLDIPYPKQNTDIWNEVAERGVLISEWPPGTRPDAFRFPLRNRILAALCEVLVVVESREKGGSLITVHEAINRSVVLMAVPGAVNSRASAGTNALIADGVQSALETADILMALGLDGRRAGRKRFDARPQPSGPQADIIAACHNEPRTLDSLLLITGLALGDLALALARLERDGWLIENGGWFEVVDEWADLTLQADSELRRAVGRPS